jgi:hypothetical protein
MMARQVQPTTRRWSLAQIPFCMAAYDANAIAPIASTRLDNSTPLTGPLT